MAPLHRALSFTQSTYIQHFTHPHHPLHLLHLPKEFLCNGCNALGGSGHRYHCITCGFNLHEYCATCPPTLHSPLHPTHLLSLVNHHVNDRLCDICGDLVNGLFYACHGCGFEVHPLCTQLPVQVLTKLHPQHVLTLQPANSAGCALCAKSCLFWMYRCDLCNFHIHLECALGESDVCGPAQEVHPVAGFGVQGISASFGKYSGIPVSQIPYVSGYNEMPLKPVVSNVQGGHTSDGKKKKKIYSMVGKVAVQAALAFL